MSAILILALAVPLAGLADLTACFTLAIFAMVNLALIRVKSREAEPLPGVFIWPRWVPIAGLISSVALLLLDQVAGWGGGANCIIGTRKSARQPTIGYRSPSLIL